MEMEEKLLDECDLILATAEELCLKKERKNKKPILLPHGVDFYHFRSGGKGYNTPKELMGISKPIIGFFGAISAWLDFNLIIEIATECPDWSFVFIGPVDTDIKRLVKFSNIHFIGKVAYEKLPVYAAAFDLAIVPFLINELTISVNPLKILEYLACGLPVVTTNLPETRKFSDVIYIANDYNEFLKNIKCALCENSYESRSKRIEVAKRHSWGNVAERLSLYINEVLRK